MGTVSTGDGRRRARYVQIACVAAVALALCASSASIAQGATVTLGAPLAGKFVPEDFSGVTSAATVFNTQLPPGKGVVASPINGTVVSWSITQAKGGPFRLRVLQPNLGGTYTAVGTSAPATPSGPATQTFTSSIPIKAGELVGLDNSNPSDELGLQVNAGAQYAFAVPALAENVPTPVELGTTPYSIGFNAQVLPAPTATTLDKKAGSIKGGTKVTIKIGRAHV